MEGLVWKAQFYLMKAIMGGGGIQGNCQGFTVVQGEEKNVGWFMIVWMRNHSV